MAGNISSVTRDLIFNSVLDLQDSKSIWICKPWNMDLHAISIIRVVGVCMKCFSISVDSHNFNEYLLQDMYSRLCNWPIYNYASMPRSWSASVQYGLYIEITINCIHVCVLLSIHMKRNLAPTETYNRWEVLHFINFPFNWTFRYKLQWFLSPFS